MGVGPTERGQFSAYCAILGGVAMVAAVFLSGDFDQLPLGSLAVLAALAAFAEHTVVRHENGAALSGSVIVSLAAVFVFRKDAPLLGPLLVGMSGAIYVPHLRDRNWQLILFNAGNFGFATLSAAAAFGVVAGSRYDVGACLAGAVAGGLAYCGVNVLMVATGLHLRRGTPIRALLPVLWGFGELNILVFAGVGVFLGKLYDSHGAWVLALFVVPIFVARQAYAAYLAAQAGREATLEVLIACLEGKDPNTAGHVRRVARFAEYMGSELGFTGSRLRRLRETALLHDIGKLIVPNQLLNKPGLLTPSEYERVRSHEAVSVELLSRIDALRMSTPALTDYGLDSPIEARIVHIADAFDAMTSTRAYRRAMSQEDALGELLANVGTQFDLECVEALVSALAQRGERWGAGVEERTVALQYGTAPPDAGAGSAGLGDLAPEHA